MNYCAGWEFREALQINPFTGMNLTVIVYHVTQKLSKLD